MWANAGEFNTIHWVFGVGILFQIIYVWMRNLSRVKVYKDQSANTKYSCWSCCWVREHRNIYETNLEDIYINIHDWYPVEIHCNRTPLKSIEILLDLDSKIQRDLFKHIIANWFWHWDESMFQAFSFCSPHFQTCPWCGNLTSRRGPK